RSASAMESPTTASATWYDRERVSLQSGFTSARYEGIHGSQGRKRWYDAATTPFDEWPR
ncbi:hypothetical protein LTR38_018280, partial [Friedmanniomyces endolithicus]